MIKLSIQYIAVFMLVFAFPIGGVSSSKLIIVFLLAYLIIADGYAIDRTIGLRKIVYFLVILIFAGYSLFLTSVLNEYDFSLVYKQFSSLVYLPFIFLFYKTLNSKDISKIIISVLIFQSIIILIAILSESFYHFTSYFRKDISDMHVLSYGRLRGNAVSGYQFYGLGSMYGYIIIYIFLTRDLRKVKNIMILIFLSIIGFITSRFTAFSIILGFFAWYIFKADTNTRKIVTLYTILGFSIGISILYFVYKNLLNESIVKIVNYQIVLPLETLFTTGKLHSSSTDALIEMYKQSNFENLVFGEGRYTAISGDGYYKEVDAGYLRMMYYFGLFGLFILLALQYFLLNLKKPGSKLDIIIRIVFFIYFLILNIKGDVFYYSVNVLTIIIGLLYFSKLNDDPHPLRKTV